MGGTRERPIGEGGHIIEDEGLPLAQRPALNFLGTGVTAVDAPGKTNVTIPGGGGGGGDVTFELLKTIIVGAPVTTATLTLDTPVDFADFSEIVIIISGLYSGAVGNLGFFVNGNNASIYSAAGVTTTESPTAIAGFTSPTSTFLEMEFNQIQVGSPFYAKWIIEGGPILDAANKRQGSYDHCWIENSNGLFSSGRGMTMINPFTDTQLSSVSVEALAVGAATIGTGTSITVYGKKLVGSPGGGGGHIIEDETVPLPTQPALNFEGVGVTVTNDIPNSATLVTIPGGAGSGNWEKVGDVTVSGGAVNSVNVNLSRTVALDGTDVSMLVAVVHTKLNATASIGYRYNNITTGGYSCNGNDLGGGSYTSFSETGNEIFTDKAYNTDGMFAILELSGQQNGSKVMGHIKEAGDGVSEATIGHFSVNTTFTAVTSFQILTIDSLLKIADGTHIVIYAVTFTAGGGGGGGTGHVIEDEGTPVAQQTNMNFVGDGVTVTDIGGKTQVSIPIGTAGHVIENEGSNLPQQEELNFIGTGVTASDIGGKTVVNIPGGGHTIEDEGTPLAQQSALNFVGAGVTAVDSGGKTVVTIPGGGGGTGSIIGEVKTVGLVNSVDIVLTETIPFDGTIAELELVATVSIDTAPDSLQVTINNDVGAVYDTTLVKVNTSGVVTGSHVAAATSWGSGETVAIGGFMSMLRIVLGVGGNLGGDRPAIEFFETCGGPPPPSTVVYREGRGIHVGTLANITSIQVKTAGGNNFIIGSQFTVFKRVDTSGGGGGSFDKKLLGICPDWWVYDEMVHPTKDGVKVHWEQFNDATETFNVPVSRAGVVEFGCGTDLLRNATSTRTCAGGGAGIALGADYLYRTRVKLGTTNLIFWAGGMDGQFPQVNNRIAVIPAEAGAVINALMFRFDGNGLDGPNYRCIARTATVETQTDSGVAADTNFHCFEIECDGVNAIFTIDGVQVANITTNIPTGINLITGNQINSLSANPSVDDKYQIDMMFIYSQTRT